jgi:hypothetical protein
LAGIIRVGAGGYRENQTERGDTLETSVNITASHRDTPFLIDAMLNRECRNNGYTRDKCRAGPITWL